MLSIALFAALMPFIKGVIMFLFVLVALVLIAIVLLQEGKGGGLAGAFGGAGAETFGVQSGGVNKFTAYIAVAFMLLAITYATIKPDLEEVAPSASRDSIGAPDDSDSGCGCGCDEGGAGDETDGDTDESGD